ncbi:SAC3/GANP/Nin1/mts3/eIF-3 p25 family-domain-containing protein [Syncephalastrum racemosum]|uniref:SAC3/GANP/Nin1/mts3/eIF-3 p25 family-domain-containing protein n=1 Tax=Syncephalastrum racemosum TaxID=13706 RepID=A0A1X2HUM1_SYNRA|nr:SAC3/GANP/Nin1/mts3/eIF-3 p25 family-domain-containing protein [Syncephalastrum racemosum]
MSAFPRLGQQQQQQQQPQARPPGFGTNTTAAPPAFQFAATKDSSPQGFGQGFQTSGFQSAFGHAHSNTPQQSAFNGIQPSAFAAQSSSAFKPSQSSAFANIPSAFSSSTPAAFQTTQTSAFGAPRTSAFNTTASSAFSKPKSTSAFASAFTQQSTNQAKRQQNSALNHNAPVFVPRAATPESGSPSSTPSDAAPKKPHKHKVWVRQSTAAPAANPPRLQRQAELPQQMQHPSPAASSSPALARSSPKPKPKPKTTKPQQKPAPKAVPKSGAMKDSTKISNKERAARFQGNDKNRQYEEMKKARVLERKKAIKEGLIPDPDNRMRLEDAIDFKGTCLTMCPDFECIERDVQMGLDKMELDEHGNMDMARMVKRYRRSAAGNEQPLPSDVRPPEVLEETLDYLFGTVMLENPLIKCHAFLRDRTRSIRQDFTLQNIRDAPAIRLHERIARFHILCLHELSHFDEEKFSVQQELEQLRKVLLSLVEFYEDRTETDKPLTKEEEENEAEFRAYYIITHAHDHETVRNAQWLPRGIFFHPHIQQALSFYNLMQRGNEISSSQTRRNKPDNIAACQQFYTKFFKLVGDVKTSFLMGCMLETHFPDIRKGALKAMNVSYLFQHRGLEAEYLRQALAYDSTKQLLKEAHLYGLVIHISNGVPYIKFGQKDPTRKQPVFFEPLSNPRQRKSLLLVEPKKFGRDLQDIVNNTPPKESPYNTIINVYREQPNVLEEHAAAVPHRPSAAEEATQLEAAIQEKERAAAAAAEAEAAAARAAADAAAQALADKQKQELAMKEHERQAEALRQKLLESQRRQKLERARAEEQRRHEAEIARQKAERRRQERSQMHAHAVSELTARYASSVLEEVLREEACIAAIHAKSAARRLRKRVIPAIVRARGRIAKRYQDVRSRNGMYALLRRANACPEKTVPEMEHAVSLQTAHAIGAEAYALRQIQDPQMEKTELWHPVNYVPMIYHHLLQSLGATRSLDDTDATFAWQLWISIDTCNSNSSKWFINRFALDNEFLRCVSHDAHLTITIRAVSQETSIHTQAVDQMGATLFVLSEHRTDGTTDDLEDPIYWSNEFDRLDHYCRQLRSQNPGIRVPFVFIYWPRTQSVQQTVQNVRI